MRKQDLIKRIQDLERRYPKLMSAELIEAKIETSIQEETKHYREQIYELTRVLSIYKEVLLTAGVITNCGADRTEYQWDGNPYRESLAGRDFHFKVNKVMIRAKGEE